jgi:hypothetical protein
VKKDKLERKLRKKAVKLARFAHENGIEHVDLFAIDHPEIGSTYYHVELYGDNDPDIGANGWIGGEADA